MKSYKEIHFNVWKNYDYAPTDKSEEERVKKIFLAELIELCERFDGPVKIKLTFEAKGNC